MRARVRASRCVLLLLLLCSFASCTRRAEPGGDDEIAIREVVRDLLGSPPAWQTVVRNADSAPHVGELRPSLEAERGAADLPALILPPPAEVVFTIGPDEDGVSFVAEVGAQGLENGAELRLEVRRNGAVERSVLLAAQGAASAEAAPPNRWVPIEPLELRAGDQLELRTELIAEGPQEAIRCGFARPRLVRFHRQPRARASQKLPNIVFIVMDTLRGDRLSCYGYGKQTTPNLDRLASRGVLFERAYATSSWTWPSTASMLTGLLPEEHGVIRADQNYLRDELTVLPEILQRQGYTTAAFVGNPLIAPGKNFDQGFEYFESAPADMEKSDQVVPRAVEWLGQHATERFFLYLHLVDPHLPYQYDPDAQFLLGEQPERFPELGMGHYSLRLRRRGAWTDEGELKPRYRVPKSHARWIGETYDAAVWTGDRWVGRMLDALESLELTERTVVVFTSDHGEELFDHGMVDHGHSLYRELVQVPLLAAGPGIPAGRRIRGVVSNQRLAQTIALIAGARLPDASPELLWDQEPAEGPIYFSTESGFWNGNRYTSIFGVSEGGWSLHWAPRGGPFHAEPGPLGDLRLFCDDRDGAQKQDLSDQETERAERMRLTLLERIESQQATRPEPAGEVGPGTLEMLKKLGYWGDDQDGSAAESRGEEADQSDR
jgi:hypothetical protein